MRIARTLRRLAATVAIAAGVHHATALNGQQYHPPPDLEPLHAPFDELLDLHVRDGLVYYRALQQDRGRLNRYIASLNAPAVAAASPTWDKDRQKAFWLNAYNAFVLETVVDRYPIRGRSSAYPPDSIRQIPGAFDRLPHLAAGRRVTLDEIEAEILTAFQDPRVFVALGRGAVGSGRLRSEAFGAALVERQLESARAQFAKTPRHVEIDRLTGRLNVSAIFSWRADSLIDAYADKSLELSGRQPLERAIIGFIRPHLLVAEEDYILRNTFQLGYQPFDWRLNDLTGGRPD